MKKSKQKKIVQKEASLGNKELDSLKFGIVESYEVSVDKALIKIDIKRTELEGTFYVLNVPQI